MSTGRVKVPSGHIPNSVVRVPCGVSRSAHVLIPHGVAVVPFLQLRQYLVGVVLYVTLAWGRRPYEGIGWIGQGLGVPH